MSEGMKRVVVVAPTLTATRPTAVPGIASALESGQMDESSLGQVEQFAYGTQIKNQLWQMPVEQQIQVYNSGLTPAQQEAVRFAGYQLPVRQAAPTGATEEDPFGGGFLSDLGAQVNRAAGAVIGAGGEAVSAVGGALSWGSDELKSGYRTSVEKQDGHWWQYLNPIEGPGRAFAGIVDNWTNDNATENGATYFNPERLKSAQDQIADETVFFYAKQIAEGKSVDSLFADLEGDEEKIAGLMVLTESEKFKQAVDLIDGAHVSPGRDLADSLGMQAGDRGYDTISGIADGAYTIFYDPLLLAGPVGNAVKASKYGLSTPGNAAKVFGQKSVQRYLDGFTSHYSTLVDDAAESAAKGEAFARIQSEYKTFAPMLDSMRSAGVRTSDDVRDYLLSADGFSRLLQGKAAHNVPLMPYRTWAGEKARQFAAAANPISFTEKVAYKLKPDVTAFYDDLAEGGEDTAATLDSIMRSRNSIMGRVSTFMTRPVQKVPFGNRLYFNDDNAADQVYKLARFVMPKYWADQTSAAFLGASVEGKRRIMRGLIDTMGQVSGATSTAAGRQSWNKLLGDAFGEAGAVHSYAPKVGVQVVAEAPAGGRALGSVAKEGTDEVYDVVRAADGSEVMVPQAKTAFTTMREPDLMPDGSRAAVFAWQNRQYVDIPDFKEMYRLMVQLPMMEQTARGGILNWGKRTAVAAGKDAKELKPMRLTGRVITNSGLEWFTQQFWKPGVLLRPALPIRNGMEEVTNFIMRHSAKEYAKGVVGTRYISDYAKSRVIWNTLDDASKKAATRGDKSAVLTGFAKWRMRAEKAVLDDQEEQFLREFVEKRGDIDLAALMDDYTDMRISVGGVKSQSGGGNYKVIPMGGRPFEQLPTDGDRGAMQWATYATSVGKSPDGRIVLENLDDRDAAIRELIDWVENGEGAWMKNSADQVKKLGVARWAENVYDATRGTFSDRNGNILDDLVRQAREDGAVDANWIIDNLADDVRPEWTSGQDFMLEKVNRGPIQTAVNWGFETSDDWVKQISRYPTFLPNYLRHRKNWAAYEQELAGRIGKGHAKTLAHSKAYEAAFRDVMEYSDNPAVRSQAAIIMRNVFPFWRAQEEFYVRWAKTGVFNPYAFRKLQLTYQGFQEVGAIYTGDDGQDVFNYPLVGEAAELVSKALSSIGVVPYMAVPIQSSSKVQYLNQGLDPNNILPSFGPGPSFLLQSMRGIWPSTAKVERLLLGDLGAGRNPFLNVLPTPIRRLLDSDEWKASSMLSAAAYLEYAGKSPPTDATPDELQKYKDDLQRWTFGLSVMRAIFGTVAPASPTVEIANPETSELWQQHAMDSVDEEFWGILGATGDYGAAMAAWMKVHPDKLPFTVSKTDTPSGAIVDSNKAVGSFIEGNTEFFKKYPSAAPFWLASTMEGDFDPETWQLLGAMGIKVPKPFEDFYQDMKVGPAISQYYDARDAHELWQEQQQAAGVSPEVLDREQSQYDAWRQMFLAQNPLVNDYLAAGGQRAQDRQNVIQQVELALADPNVPASASTQIIGNLVAAYRSHTGWQAQMTGTDDATLQAKQQEQAQYEAYMSQLAAQDPAAKMMWDRLFRYAE